MKIINVTKPIENEKIYYPNSPAPKIEILHHYSLGDNHWSSLLQLSLHSATHIDAPAHFLPDGKTTEEISLNTFISFAQVIDCSKEKIITKECLKRKNISATTLLFKTKSGINNYTYLDVNAAKFLVKNGIKIIGLESQSVDCFKDKDFPVHKILLNHDVLIVEGLNLKGAKEGTYIFVCLPLLIKNVEAAPARAILIRG